MHVASDEGFLKLQAKIQEEQVLAKPPELFKGKSSDGWRNP